MAFDATRAGILDRLSPDGQKASRGKEILQRSEQQPALQGAREALGAAVEGRRAAVDSLEADAARGQRFFARTATLKAAEAGTRVALLPEAELAAGERAYPVGFFMVLAGEEAWSGGTGTRIFLADSGTDLIYRFASIAASALVPGNFITPSAEGVTLEAEFGLALGGRVGKGIDVLADGDFETGSELSVTVYGYIVSPLRTELAFNMQPATARLRKRTPTTRSAGICAGLRRRSRRRLLPWCAPATGSSAPTGSCGKG